MIKNIDNPKYYKIQIYSEVSCSYIDIQKKYDIIEEASNNMPKNRKCRIMVIDGKKRYPLINA